MTSWVRLLGVVSTASVLVGCGGSTSSTSERSASTSSAPVGDTSRVPTVATEPPIVTEELTATVGLVRIETCNGGGSGSGFFVTPTTFITNRHVVVNATTVRIEMPTGARMDVSHIETSTQDDLARLTVPTPTSAFVTLSPDDAKPGDDVRVIGYPRGGPLTGTEGRIVSRASDESSDGERLRISAVIEPGNSGGPAIDSMGRVVGVATALDLRSGIGLIIPVSHLKAPDQWAERPAPTC